MKTKPITKNHQKKLEAIATYFRELRLNENITQGEVSRETGLNRNTIYRIETSKNFSVLTLLILSDLYHLSPSEIFSILD